MTKNKEPEAKNINENMNVNIDNEPIKCFICGKIFKNKAGLTRHIASSKELEHIEYRERIERLKASYEDSEGEDYKTIGCNPKKGYVCKCDECYNNNSLGFINCLRNEKRIYQSVKKKADKEEARKHRMEVHANEAKERALKKDDINSPINLLRFFYATSGGTCINYSLELRKIRNMLNAGVTPDCIRDAFALIRQSGQKDLRYFGRYVISEAATLKKYEEEVNKEGTLPYYVKKYYDGTGAQYSQKLLSDGVSRLKKVVNTFQLNKEKLNYVIDYMIVNRIRSFNFLEHSVSEALREFASKEETVKDDNYYMQSALADIIDGKTTVDEAIQIYGMKFDENTSFPRKALSILENDQYNKIYTAMEWAWKVNFHFNQRTYRIAKEHNDIHKKTNLNGYEREQYLSWLKEQEERFDHEHFEHDHESFEHECNQSA